MGIWGPARGSGGWCGGWDASEARVVEPGTPMHPADRGAGACATHRWCDGALMHLADAGEGACATQRRGAGTQMRLAGAVQGAIASHRRDGGRQRWARVRVVEPEARAGVQSGSGKEQGEKREGSGSRAGKECGQEPGRIRVKSREGAGDRAGKNAGKSPGRAPGTPKGPAGKSCGALRVELPEGQWPSWWPFSISPFEGGTMRSSKNQRLKPARRRLEKGMRPSSLGRSMSGA